MRTWDEKAAPHAKGNKTRVNKIKSVKQCIKNGEKENNEGSRFHENFQKKMLFDTWTSIESGQMQSQP